MPFRIIEKGPGALYFPPTAKSAPGLGGMMKRFGLQL